MKVINANFLPEVLSPAGSMESLAAAVRSGADAVYIGAKRFSARRNAENFDDEQLKSAVSYCHIRGVKVYLALNIMLKQSELADALNLVAYAAGVGIDGIIVQDLGLARLINEQIPDIELHASTQMSLHSPAALETLKRMGFVRVVAAREMSRLQLQEFCREAKRLDMQVEVFVHGALCMCVSGQCLLSSVIGGRSGNRGLCAGPCRLPFMAEGGTGYDLSLKDLSLFERITELKALGVDSLKIEGRMKRPEYIAAATAACRQAVDSNSVEKQLFDTLKKVFTRSGFTSGYFDNKKGKDMFGVRTDDDAALSKETYAQIHNLYRNERQSMGVSINARILRDKPILLSVSDGKNTVTVTGEVPTTAQNKSATKEDVEAALSKLGGTPYKASKIDVEIDNGLFVPNSLINALRREAVEQLSVKRAGVEKTVSVNYTDESTDINHEKTPKILARFSCFENIPKDLSGISGVIVPSECEIPKELSPDVKWIADIPRLIGDEQKLYDRLILLKENGFVGAYCGNLSAAVLANRAGLKVIGGIGLNVCNSESIKALGKFKVDAVTISAESNMRDAVNMKSNIPKGIIAYGYLPLMLLANCPVKNGKDCKTCDGRGYLTDRKGIKFPIRCRNREFSELLNSTPLYLADRLLQMQGMSFIILYFTDESPSDAQKIIEEYKNGGNSPSDYMRGLYYRSIF